jgi:hypothetical protein
MAYAARVALPARHDGGRTHVRYGHRHLPARIAVRCPSCAGHAEASWRAASDRDVVGIDLAGIFADGAWQLACTACPHRVAAMGYDGVQRMPLVFASARGAVWAWNAAHLELVIAVLERRPPAAIAAMPYATLATYVPGAWRRRAAATARQARALRL